MLATDGSGAVSWADVSAKSLADTDGNTQIQVEESDNEDIIRFDLGGTEFMRLDSGRIEIVNNGTSVSIGEGAGVVDSSSDARNVFIGYESGNANTDGDANTFVGQQSGYSNTTGEDNTFIGRGAGYSNDTGGDNTFLGRSAGRENTTGSDNVFVGRGSAYFNESGSSNVIMGRNSGFNNLTGYSNTFLGRSAGYSNESGYDNTIVGRGAGYNNVSGHSNIFLGYQAGYDETGDNKLYIQNSISSSPLIYGEFDNDFLQINGRLSTTGGLTDADGDTKIQVEESSNEDIIRFDLGGTEFMRLDSGRIETYNTGNSVFIGEDAGQNDDYDGNVNVFVGYKAGQDNTTGYRNTFIGAESGDANISGDENIFVGFKAGYSSTTGNQNTMLGDRVGFKNISGSDNVLIGAATAYNATTGYGNTMVGYAAGLTATGDRNVFLGYKAGSNETGDNKLYIANSDTSNPLIYGEFNNKLLTVNGSMGVKESLTGGSNYVFTIENTQNDNSDDNSGLLIKAGHDDYNASKQSSLIRFNTPNGTNLGRIRQESGSEIKLITSSDRRLKENILPTKYGLADILKIEVKDYNFITDADDHVKTGFIAQQLHPIFPTAVAVGDDPKTNPWGVDYAGLTPLLVKGIQDQQQFIDAQSEIIERQQQEIDLLQQKLEKIDALEARLEAFLQNQ
ncbi:MAG: tail fiber domain-containing protein [Bacteroidota bacterium]